MSMPNPQRDQILRILTNVPLSPSHVPLSLYAVHQETRYYIAEGRGTIVDCLGVYDDDGVAIFGEWQGREDQKPRISLGRIEACMHAFLVRSATDAEEKEFGARRVVVYLKVETAILNETEDCILVVFRPTEKMGCYNPVV